MPAPWAVIGRFHRDARLFLVTSFVAGAALSLYWIDFNLYLASLGLSTATIGLVSTLASVAGRRGRLPGQRRLGPLRPAGGHRRRHRGRPARPARAARDRRRCRSSSSFAALWSAGQQAMRVVGAPFMTEHSEPEHRNELFAVQFAIQNVTNIVAAVLGGVVAVGHRADRSGSTRRARAPTGSSSSIMAVLLVAALANGRPAAATTGRDRRGAERRSGDRRARGVPARSAAVAVPGSVSSCAIDAGSCSCSLPGLLIAIGAGQVIPFLNLYVQRKFGLDLASLNAVFAVTSLGTVAGDPGPARPRPALRADHLGRHRPGR